MNETAIHSTAIVDPGARLGTGVRIGPYAVIEADVVLGDRCVIGPRALIGSGARLAEEVQVYHAASVSCLPQDHVLAPVLAEAVAQSVENGSLVQVSAVDHDSHLLAVELKKAFQSCHITPAHHFEFKPGQVELAPMIRRVIRARPSAVILLADAQESARVLRALRTAGCGVRVFGGPWMGQGVFLGEAGDAAEGVVFPRLFVPSQASADFQQAFVERTGRQPDYLSAHSYDAIRLIIKALHQSGLNRAGLCQALKAQSGYTGVTGAFHWDKLGSNTRPVGLGIVQAGAVKAYGEKCKVNSVELLNPPKADTGLTDLRAQRTSAALHFSLFALR